MNTKLYTELAAWWPLVSSPLDYAEEAEKYGVVLEEACSPESLLELGSGGGNTASHLKARFAMTLVDRSAQMLEVSRTLNPGCRHEMGDMRSVRLGETFDAVLIHDAVDYLTTEADLAATFQTAFLHCKPGGAALILPGRFLETWREEIGTGGHEDGPRSLRYLEWHYDPDPADTIVESFYVFLLREGGTPTRVVTDRHELGIFPREVWQEQARSAGFQPEIVRFQLTHPDPLQAEGLLCRRPA